MIKKVGNKWCLFTRDGSRKLGCHPTKQGAIDQEKAVMSHEMTAAKAPNRFLLLAKGDAVNSRKETYLGREWLVVPVVALVEGVIHAMNAKAPEFVPEDAFNDMTSLSWNGRPVFIGHPVNDQGRPVSGNSPEVLEALSFGQVFNVGITDGKLTMEAWLDVERASIVPDGEALLTRIAEGKPIEISIGAFIEIDESAVGVFKGLKFEGKWITIAPDHLALLPEGDEGACSRKMGCGVRTARGAEITMADEKKPTKKNPIANMIGRALALFRAEQSPESMSDNDIRAKLFNAVRAMDMRAYPVAVYDMVEPYTCVYEVYSDGQSRYYSREFSMDGDGKVTLGDPTEVEPILTYEPVGASQVEPTVAAAAITPAPAAAEPTAAKTSCGCGGHAPAAAAVHTEETNMERKARIEALIGKLASKGFTSADVKFLEAATDAQLDNMEKLAAETPAAAPAAAAPAAAAEVVAPAVAAAAPKVPTTDEFIAGAPAEVANVLRDAMSQASARKDATIKVLTGSGRCDMTAEVLGGKSQAELDSLVKLAGLASAPQGIDYSGQGVSRVANVGGDQTAPAAPDLAGALRTARGQK